jgi:ATP-dependent Lon protease
LLEVLDPAQNHRFRDHYLEFELDLSEVVFIATANRLDTIPAALLDRVELIEIDGYTDDEKAVIGRRHVLPRIEREMGLTDDDVEIDDDVLEAIVSDWTRDAGLRSLERRLAKVVRKAATRLVANPDAAPIVIDIDDVRDALGKPIPRETLASRSPAPGVATGLAVTGAGGDVLFVEATDMPGEPGLTLTGQLGDVMKESGELARSYLRSHATELGIDDANRRFHVHFPAGAVPKDGPSAGVTMTTALVSLLTGRRVRPDVAMTGEISLHGQVLPIGGVKQKLLAAHRAGIDEVILPAKNGVDLDDVPPEVRDALTIHLVDTVDQVLAIALEPADAMEPAA